MAIEGESLIFTALEDNTELDLVKGDRATLGKKTSGLSISDFENMECK